MSEAVVETIALPAAISRLQLIELKTYVDGFLIKGKIVKFDASMLQKVDGALLQFLLVYVRSYPAENPVVFNATSELLDALNDIGVSAELMASFTVGKALECAA